MSQILREARVLVDAFFGDDDVRVGRGLFWVGRGLVVGGVGGLGLASCVHRRISAVLVTKAV